MSSKFKPDRIQSLEEFWPFYLAEHKSMTNRRLHIVGTSIALLFFGIAILKARVAIALVGIVGAYACAWIGHFVFEGNRPATFRYPLWSLRADLKAYLSVLGITK